eukprot:767566-Hanusia_phi.AAC.2
MPLGRGAGRREERETGRDGGPEGGWKDGHGGVGTCSETVITVHLGKGGGVDVPEWTRKDNGGSEGIGRMRRGVLSEARGVEGGILLKGRKRG